MTMQVSGECDCCASAERLPLVRYNAPAQPAVRYRIATHGEFKAALMARLSSAAYPALKGLRTREDDDFTIALCDSHALMLDVIAFYQERIVNESYLRTATERRSILELARLIGYQLAPGVAASTRLAFSLEDSPGLRSLAARPVTIPIGTRVQSVPGPDEQPQTFETTEAITARAEWNAVPVQTTEAQTLPKDTRELYLDGLDTQLQPGDMLLLVGAERDTDETSKRWAVRPLQAVETNGTRKTTRITWAEGLGDKNPDWESDRAVRAYVLRARAALFGHNAPEPKLLKLEADNDTTDGTVWLKFPVEGSIFDLDAVYPKVVSGGWVVLAGGTDLEGDVSLPGSEILMQINSVRQLSLSGFALTGRITRVEGDVSVSAGSFERRETLVLLQSEELTLANKPLNYPLYGSELSLARRSDQLAPKQTIALSGKRSRLRILVDDPSLEFTPVDGDPIPVKPRDSFTIIAPPVFSFWGAEFIVPASWLSWLLSTSLFLTWHLADDDGHQGTLFVSGTQVALQPALDDDPVVHEICTIANLQNAVQHESGRTILQLDAPLANVYDRLTASVCANLAPATHGEAVGEVGGSGNAAVASQQFVLKQAPLTYVSASTTSGRQSTLEMRVDGLLWSEVPSLFDRGPNEHVYSLRRDDKQRTIVQLGDGVEGARLPTGRDNVRFSYRRYLGAAGNVRAGQLTTLLGRPLGVKTVTNPVEARGGQDGETRDDARRNAPITVLTLGRVVSVQDYTDFTRGFAGIAKALAIWVGGGTSRGIFMTIAGPDGAPIEESDATYSNLIEALRKYGDPLVPLHVRSFQPVAFQVEARVIIAPDALAELVLPVVETRLRQHFSFAARDFAQPVTLDEVMAVVHGVDGVEAVDVDALYRIEPNVLPSLNERIFAQPPQILDDGTLFPGELMTLDPAPLSLTVMP